MSGNSKYVSLLQLPVDNP